MKRLLVCLAVLFMVTPAMAQTFQFPDTSLLVPWAAGFPTGGGPVDILPLIPGSPDDVFATSQINVVLTGSDVTFQIFTNYPLAGSPPIPGLGGASIPMADLAVDLNHDGVYERAVVLTAHGTSGQGLWNGVSWHTSNDLFAGSNIEYGGAVFGSPPPVDAQITAGTFVRALASPISTTLVDNTVGAETTHMRYDVDLGNVNASGTWNNFSFLFGTGTCANDILVGTVVGVPEPAALLLLGFGLIGIAGVRKKFTK